MKDKVDLEQKGVRFFFPLNSAQSNVEKHGIRKKRDLKNRITLHKKGKKYCSLLSGTEELKKKKKRQKERELNPLVFH